MTPRPQPDLAAAFAAAMDRLGPFEPRPKLAVAVSGGADSLALTLLAQDWAAGNGGSVLALTVDHGLRPEAREEADATLAALARHGIFGRKLTIQGLACGPGLGARAREGRYGVLLEACAAHDTLHLLLAHHRSDQVETAMMRVLSASGGRGLAAMPGVSETRFVRLLRPLLNEPPGVLRAFLTAQGLAWIEDPSNRDPAALRARIRLACADPAGTGDGTAAVARAVRAAGEHRARRDGAIAAILAERASIRPEGYALLSPGPIDPEALAALLRTVGGAAYAPSIERVAVLARDLSPATLGGVRIMAAGRLDAGWLEAGRLDAGRLDAGRLEARWLLVREARAMAPPVPARPNAVWDGRFRLVGAPPGGLDQESMFGGLGAASARFNDRRRAPAAVLHGLPALWRGGIPIAAPHIGLGDPGWRIVFDPRHPAAGAPFGIGA